LPGLSSLQFSARTDIHGGCRQRCAGLSGCGDHRLGAVYYRGGAGTLAGVAGRLSCRCGFHTVVADDQWRGLVAGPYPASLPAIRETRRSSLRGHAGLRSLQCLRAYNRPAFLTAAPGLGVDRKCALVAGRYGALDLPAVTAVFIRMMVNMTFWRERFSGGL